MVVYCVLFNNAKKKKELEEKMRLGGLKDILKEEGMRIPTSDGLEQLLGVLLQ